MDFMELLELVQSLALMFAGAALLGLVLKTERVNENARNTAIAQRGTESYATRRFAEVSKEIEKADECAEDARLLAFECSVAFVNMREALTDDGR